MTTGIILLVVVAYLALLLLLRLNESRLIYFPGPTRSLLPPPAHLGLPFWLLICHGNAGNLSEFGRPDHYAGLRQLGLHILAFDYRGYGESKGVPTETGLYAVAQAAYRFLRERKGIPPERIVVFGHSLGSAIAIDLVSRQPAAGLIVEGALTSVLERGQELYPFIPVRWLAVSRYESMKKISRVTIPKLFLHASGDEVIPLAHGRRLFDAAPEPKTFVELSGGHGDAFDLDSARYFGSIERFIASLSASSR
jgi:fermentation-respiration switch protein FrsA (DUF1100 family)